MTSVAIASFAVAAVLSATQLANALPTYNYALAARGFNDGNLTHEARDFEFDAVERRSESKKKRGETYEARELYDFDADAVERRSDFDGVELVARANTTRTKGKKKREVYEVRELYDFDVDAVERRSDFEGVELVARANSTRTKGKKKRETYEARELYDFDVDAVERRSDFEEIELVARGNYNTTRLPTKGKKKRDLEVRGCGSSKIGDCKDKKTKLDPDRKAKYDTGNPRPETPKGEYRQFTAGKKDDYFGDWQTQTNGVHNPAAGKGKKKRALDFESLEDLE